MMCKKCFFSKKEGFTLIELLAVIVILAIIALIATPIILNIIGDARNQSEMRSAELYLNGVELSYADKNINTDLGNVVCDVQSNGNLMCGSTLIKVEMSNNNTAKAGRITFENGKISRVENLEIGSKKFNTDSNGNLVATPNTDNVVYRYNTYSYGIGDLLPATSITTDYTTLRKNYFLKHKINSENTIVSTEVCFISNTVLYCLLPNDFYNSLSTIQRAFPGCTDNSCTSNGLTVSVTNSGDVTISDPSGNCQVSSTGSSYCR